MNPRRRLVLAFGAGLSGRAALLRAQTSSESLRRVGVLAPSTQAKEDITLKPFFDRMRELGWIEGRNIAYDRVYANDQQDRLPRLAAKLVARKPELIYAPPTPSAVAAKQATQTIPIVFTVVFDPMGGLGLVTSLARPGGNVTGIAFSESLAPKRIEMLREFLPHLKRLGILGDSTDPSAALDRQAIAPLAASLGLTMTVAEAANPIARLAVAKLIADRVDAIIVVGGVDPCRQLARAPVRADESKAHCGHRGRPVVCRCRRDLQLLRVIRRSLAPLGTVGGQDSQRRQAGRPAGGAADIV